MDEEQPSRNAADCSRYFRQLDSYLMRRLRQQFWFWLAGFCSVGSFLALFSPDIEMQKSEVAVEAQAPLTEVFRRLSDLPPADRLALPSTASDGRMPWEVSGRLDNRLPAPALFDENARTTGQPLRRASGTDSLTPVGFSQGESNFSASRPPARPVWLTGRIEEAPHQQ